MSADFRPVTASDDAANPYTVKQIDEQGDVLSETRVVARSYSSALREMDRPVEGVDKIEVYNQGGEKAGEVNAEYWRSKKGR
jgi:hypothetical protein